ncbi:MAG: UDP-N-acetylglucosamine 1-carboxyvinyltransferase, partial [Nitrospirae bacterium]|nr:UDP-N-acetylglucosamine 1-carboxyvinyltransferase [Nitrospirota bacterium]
MDKLVIRGSKPLKGEISISGAKNAALPILAASILSSGENTFSRIPALRDVSTMGKLLTIMGSRFDYKGGSVMIDSSDMNNFEAPYELVKTM